MPKANLIKSRKFPILICQTKPKGVNIQLNALRAKSVFDFLLFSCIIIAANFFSCVLDLDRETFQVRFKLVRRKRISYLDLPRWSISIFCFSVNINKDYNRLLFPEISLKGVCLYKNSPDMQQLNYLRKERQ